MGFTYAVQVPVGRELQVKVMIENMMKRLGNPGVIAIHALETFTQTLSEKGLSARQWKAKLPGYVFVTIANAYDNRDPLLAYKDDNCSAKLGMEASCWHLIKQIPLVRRILNLYIKHDEWKDFFENVDLEPEIQLIEREATNVALTEHTETNHEESPIITLIETVTEAIEEKLEEGKEQVAVVMEKTVTAVRTVVKGCKTMYAIPYKLYKVLVKQHRKEEGDKAKPMSVQSALKGLKALLKAVIVCRT